VVAAAIGRHSNKPRPWASTDELLSDWLTDLPRNDFLTERGGTFLPDANDTLLYSHRELGILGFSQTMVWPIDFLVCFWNQICIQARGWPIGNGHQPAPSLWRRPSK